MTTAWTDDHVRGIAAQSLPSIPYIRGVPDLPHFDGLDLWDCWPVQTADGATALFDGWTVWMFLSAAQFPDPIERHSHARIRVATCRDNNWIDCGALLPDGLTPGSREWAGSALYDPATSRLTLFYTVAGRRGEPSPTFEQRLFQVSGTLSMANGRAVASDWGPVIESVVSDDVHYMVANQQDGSPGAIIGFRDPAHVRDPATGRDYLLFTGSLKGSNSSHNGVVGIATTDRTDHIGWRLLPPLVSADGLNNELERPHIICRDGRYYLFWSTQRHVFHPDGPHGPNGLYGMVADRLLGPYRPLNGTGLVAPNPVDEPTQCYSWWVTGDLDVIGFIDYWGMAGAMIGDRPDRKRSHFGGRPAPMFRIAVDGDQAIVAAP